MPEEKFVKLTYRSQEKNVCLILWWFERVVYKFSHSIPIPDFTEIQLKARNRYFHFLPEIVTFFFILIEWILVMQIVVCCWIWNEE